VICNGNKLIPQCNKHGIDYAIGLSQATQRVTHKAAYTLATKLTSTLSQVCTRQNRPYQWQRTQV